MAAPEPTQFVCDTLLFVAVSAEEDALKAVAHEMGLPFRKHRGIFATYWDLGGVGRRRVGAVRTAMGPFGSGGSAAQAIRCRHETQATSLIGLGMAFGVQPDRQEFADVLVSSCLLPYDDRTVRCAPGVPPIVDYTSVRRFDVHRPLLELFRKAKTMPSWNGRAHIGPMLTGGARIHCAAFRDELARALSDREGPVIGGDMEGGGLLSSSRSADPIWIVVKGISDFADHDRDEIIAKTRGPACQQAARFVLTALLWEESLHGTT